MGKKSASFVGVLMLGSVAATVIAACSGTTLPYAGGLMLAVQTDLVAPKDVAEVGLFISSDGRPIFSDTRAVAPSGVVEFPATIAVVADPQRPKAAIKVRVVAFGRDGTVRVLRDALTTVPKGRTGLLRMPLLWINLGSGSGKSGDVVKPASVHLADSDGFTKLKSACPDGSTFINGACADAHVDADMLPEYSEADVFGGGAADGTGGSCFDVKTCFATRTFVDLDETCAATLPQGRLPNDPKLSFAVVLPESPAGVDASTGECVGEGACLVALDPGTGWTTEGSKVRFPAAICKKITDGTAKGIAASFGCASKTNVFPICGPASAIHPSGAGGMTPGGAGEGGFVGTEGGVSAEGGVARDGAVPPTSVDFDPAVSAKVVETNATGIAVDATRLYVSRAGDGMLAPGVVSIGLAAVFAGDPAMDTKVLFQYPPPAADQKPHFVLDDPKAPTHIVIGDPVSGTIVTCMSAAGCMPNTPVFSGLQGGALAANKAGATYFGAAALSSFDYNNEPGATLQHATPVTAMYVAGGQTLYIGNNDGSIERCILPCTGSDAGTLEKVRDARAGVFITAFASGGDNLLYFLEAPKVDGDPNSGGLLVLDMNNAMPGTSVVVTGAELAGAADLSLSGPAFALAADTRYVYWASAGHVFAKARQMGASPQSVSLGNETDGFVTGLATNSGYVFWSILRTGNTVSFAKKKSAF